MVLMTLTASSWTVVASRPNTLIGSHTLPVSQPLVRYSDDDTCLKLLLNLAHSISRKLYYALGDHSALVGNYTSQVDQRL